MAKPFRWRILLVRPGFGSAASATGYSKAAAFALAMQHELYVKGGKTSLGAVITPDLSQAFQECFEHACLLLKSPNKFRHRIAVRHRGTGAGLSIRRIDI